MNMKKILNSIVNSVLHPQPTVEVRFSPYGYLFHDGIKPGDRWLIFSVSRWRFILFRRWTRPARFQGEGEPRDEPPPRLEACSLPVKLKRDFAACWRSVDREFVRKGE